MASATPITKLPDFRGGTVVIYGLTTINFTTLNGYNTTTTTTLSLFASLITTSGVAPTPTTSVPSPSPSTTASSSRLPDGTVAGIAVGVAVVASLLTFLATFFMMKSRRSHSHSKHRRDGEKRGDFLSSKSMRNPRKGSISRQPDMAFGHVGAAPVSRLDSHLSPSEDDHTIQNDVNEVLDQIGLHVDNYYHSSALPVPKEVRAELGVFNSSDLRPLVELLPQCPDSLPIIKHCLTRQILARTSLNSDPNITFLPMEFSLLPNTLERLKLHKPRNTVAFSEAFSRWRVLTTYLYLNPTSDNIYLTLRDHRIEAFVNSVSQAFSPWVKTSKDPAVRARHLTAILKSAADKGILLFSQPSTFEFYWGPSNDLGNHQLVVTPALLKVADEKGQSLPRPQPMIPWTVVTI